MSYDPENYSVVLTDNNGKEYNITGFADSDLNFEQAWHRVVGELADGTYQVYCMDNNFCGKLVHFTKEGYDRHIKDLKPSVERVLSSLIGLTYEKPSKETHAQVLCKRCSAQ